MTESRLYIEGGKKLSGEISVHGAKNSVLPVLAAALLSQDVCRIENCPALSDVYSSTRILRSLGCKCRRDGSALEVDARTLSGCEISEDLMREMRSSIVFLGAILGRLRRCRLSFPGGCELGPRPIDIHLSGLSKLGAKITEDHGVLDCTLPQSVSGADMTLPLPSVGATENIMLAAVLGSGETVIRNAAREPEISDLAGFLNACGAKISGQGSSTVTVKGVGRLHGAEYSVMPDRIVAAGELAEHSKKRLEYAQEQELLNRKAGVAEAEIADKARQADEGYQSVGVTVEGLRMKMERLSEPSQTLLANMATLNDVMRQYAEADDDKTKIALWERMQELIASCRREITGLAAAENGSVRQFKLSQSLEKAQADLETIRRTWSAFQWDQGLRTQFQLLEEGLHRCNTEADFKKWSAELNTFKSQVKAAGLNTLSFADAVKDAFGKVAQWFSATSMIFKTFNLIKRGVRTVIELDTAMVDLRKTTDATEAEYRQFYDTANETAKRLNMTTEAVISQTASWSRLGYSMDAAAKLAENSAIFAAVSPEMTVDEATDGLVSILKAFDIEAENSLDGIISKVNEVGNRFAVTNKDIVDALTRSSSAMAAANNTFEETIALATAGIEITRDSEGMGQGLKTLSMRIRAIDEETEEYSEDIAILRGQIADLTKVASNNYTGVSLFEPGAPETYRSTYDILQDISKIWGELTDKNRAQLLEALFGKRQANVCLYAQKCA